MLWLVVLALSTVALVFARIVHLRRRTSEFNMPWDAAVTLSVLPTRTAVVMIDLGADASSAAVAPLVEHAVNDAFALETVDVVEVRSPDGHVLDRRCRADVINA